MNVAALRASGYEIGFDPETDVLQTSAIVYRAREQGGESAVIICGGGAVPEELRTANATPTSKNFGMEESGLIGVIEFTDARPIQGACRVLLHRKQLHGVR